MDVWKSKLSNRDTFPGSKATEDKLY